jgi:hypothetical protein
LLLFADVDIDATGVRRESSSKTKVIGIGGGRFYRPISATRKSKNNDDVSHTPLSVNPDHARLLWADRVRLGNHNTSDSKPGATGGAHIVKLHMPT